MEIKIKRTINYTPKWNNNKKTKTPIVFHLRYLSVGEMNDCFKIPEVVIDKDGKAKRGNISLDTSQLFNYSVISIDNLTVDDGENKTEIDKPETLLTCPGLDELYYEVLSYVKSMNARLDAKK